MDDIVDCILFCGVPLKALLTQVSDTKIGGAAGLGAEFMVTPQLGLGIDLRYHLISDGVGDATAAKPSFFSAAALIAYHY